MKDTKTLLSVSVRLVVAMLVPLRYSQSQGFMGSQTTAYAMTWSWNGVFIFHALAVPTALLISTPVILFAAYLSRSVQAGYPAKMAITSSTLLLLLPFLEIPNLMVPDESVSASPYLVPFGFCSMLWLLFVFIPSLARYVRSLTPTAEHRVRSASLLGFVLALALPFLGLEYHGVLGFDETYVMGYLVQFSHGRWGLTNEMVITSVEPLAEFGTLAAHLPVILLTIPRLLFALYLARYLAGHTSLAALSLVGVMQETITMLYVVVIDTAILPTPGTTRYMVPLPILLPSLLLLSWALRRLGKSDRATSVSQEDIIAVPFLVRTESRLLSALGRHSAHDLNDTASLEENDEAVQQP